MFFFNFLIAGDNAVSLVLKMTIDQVGDTFLQNLQ